jgi:hypothetical protein
MGIQVRRTEQGWTLSNSAGVCPHIQAFPNVCQVFVGYTLYHVLKPPILVARVRCGHHPRKAPWWGRNTGAHR